MSHFNENLVTDTKSMADFFDITPRWLHRVAQKGWIKPSGRNQWPVGDTIRGYIAFQKDSAKESPEQALSRRVTDARARQIELSNAQTESHLIDREEVQQLCDFIISVYLDSFDDLPRQISQQPAERERITKILEGKRLRLKKSFEDRLDDVLKNRH